MQRTELENRVRQAKGLPVLPIAKRRAVGRTMKASSPADLATLGQRLHSRGQKFHEYRNCKTMVIK